MNNNHKDLITRIALWLHQDFELDLEWYWDHANGTVDWGSVLQAVSEKDENLAEYLAEMLEYEGVYN